jgi:hypothetical protein
LRVDRRKPFPSRKPGRSPKSELMNDVNSLKSFEARLTQLEKSGRRWRLACFAVMVLAVGMGAVANEALQDAEFGVVKAKRFELTDSKGVAIGAFYTSTSEGKEITTLIVTESAKKRATVITPGKNPLVVDNE